MYLKELTIMGLYGYMDKHIEFKPGINLLVGINGCGKTSILNIIKWVTSLSIANIAVLDFKSISLGFMKNKSLYELSFIQKDYIITIDLENKTKGNKYKPITVRLKVNPKDIGNSCARNDALNFYKNLIPESGEIRTWQTLNNLITPSIAIGLDRTYENKDALPDPKVIYKNIHSPIDDVKKIAKEGYGSYKTSMISLNKKLNTSIMMSTFEKIYNEQELMNNLTQPVPNESSIDKLESKIISYIYENTMPNLWDEYLEKVNLYFKDFKNVLSKKSRNDNPYSYIINIYQMQKIRSLIKEFENFEKKSNLLYSKIKKYLDVVNSFLEDSSKKIYFSENGDLKYSILNSEGKTFVRNKDIETLSSGEQQILIQFTYLWFCDNKKSAFMIDEPELSLHPKWLELYIENIEKSLQNNQQFLIATHSPVIVNHKKENCIVLYPYNIENN